MAQLGEFSFIIAGLGVSLGVMRDFIYPIIVAVAVISTFTTPYCIRMANPVYNKLDRRIPPRIKARLDEYSLVSNGGKSGRGWQQVISTSLARTIIFLVCGISVILLSFNYMYPFTLEKLKDNLPEIVINIINCLVTLLVLSPFLLGLIRHGARTQAIYSKLWSESNLNRVVIVAWTLMRIFIACDFVLLVLSKSFRFSWWVLLIIALAIVIFFSFSRRVLRRYVRLEENFMHNLNAKEREEAGSEAQ